MRRITDSHCRGKEGSHLFGKTAGKQVNMGVNDHRLNVASRGSVNESRRRLPRHETRGREGTPPPDAKRNPSTSVTVPDRRPATSNQSLTPTTTSARSTLKASEVTTMPFG